MNKARAGESLLRVRGDDAASRVTFVELFFDLIFVFAITQLSHTLLEHLTYQGLLQTTVLFLAVWWVWIYTSWATNWLDPEKSPVRLMLFALMLAGLAPSTSVPKAFEAKGLAFAGAYVAMQIGRCLFTLWALKGRNHNNYRNFQRITSWLALSAVFWLAGAFAEGQWRVGLWLAALLIEYVSPSLRFWTPGLGASDTQDWDVEGHHMAERCGLFIILALGESILVTGNTFADLPWAPVTVATFLVAFIGSAAMWWIYFNIGAERASKTISHSSDPGRVARLSYTYLHIPLVAGIIVTAVGDELMLTHPADSADAKATAILLGAPAIYLAGNLAFKRVTTNSRALSHMIGLGLLLVLVPAAPFMNILTLGAAATFVLVVVATQETLSLRSKPLRPRHIKAPD